VSKGAPVDEVVNQQPTVTLESTLSDFVPSTQPHNDIISEIDEDLPADVPAEHIKDEKERGTDIKPDVDISSADKVEVREETRSEIDHFSSDEEGEDIDLEESTVDDASDMEKKTDIVTPHPIIDMISEINSESDSRELVLGR